MTTPNVMMCLIDEDAGMSMLAKTRFFLVKLFLLLISWELNDRVREHSATEGDSRTPDYPLNLISSFMYTCTI